MPQRGWLLILSLWCVGLVVPVTAAEPLRYDRDIKPLLKERCAYCHGALKQEAGLRVDTAELLKKGGDSGLVVEPGKVDGSTLLERISESEESLRMPPEGAPLKPEQIELIRRWVAEGMPAPADEVPEKDPKQHWSFQPIKRPAIPVTTLPGWDANPIDPFIAEQLEKKGLQPNPEADKATLLRRVTIDLIGLPPTPAELHAFLEDESPEAYGRVVDRLLSSPQYGERWGRHWMDVWRYSDWYGRRSVPDVMNSYPQIWRWRDWIVRSLNTDKGYDRMVKEMLAADEICPTEPENLVATGFIVRNWFKWNYNSWMKDQVEHTSKAFLGLTMNCCQCHDHKYDPLTQRDYFQFRAFFEPLELRHDRLPGETDPGPFKKYVYAQSYGPISTGMVSVFDEKLDAQTFLYVKGDERNLVKDQAIPPGIPASLSAVPFEVRPVSLPPAAHYPGLKPFVRQEELSKLQKDLPAAESAAQHAAMKWEEQRQGLEAAVTAAREKLPSAVASQAERVIAAPTSVINGEQSLHLISMGGRQVLANAISQIADLKSVKEISATVRILKDGHFNLQLAGDFATGQTAAWISFQKGKLVTYDPGYKEIEIGKYDTGAVPHDYRFVMTPDFQQRTSRIQVYDLVAPEKPIADATASLGVWGHASREKQGLWLDIKESGEVTLDDLKIVYGESGVLTFDFEAAELLSGVSFIGQQGWTNAVFSAGTTRVEISSRLASSPEALAALRTYRTALLNQSAAALDQRLAEARLADLRAQLLSLEKRIAADDQKFVRGEDATGATREAATSERAARFATAQLALLQAEREVVSAELTHLAQQTAGDGKTGDQLAKAQSKCEVAKDALKSVQSAEVQEAKYTALSPQYPATSTGRRTALAEWLVHEEQPLTPRVAVNHIWMRHFGRGLVETPFDFGLRGKAPSHPELLDWLAAELRDHHWSMKHLHRLIVTSRAYRSTSRPGDAPAENLSRDKENRLYWRFNSYRVQAEVVRDAVLSSAGLLDPQLGGHEIDQTLGLDVPRRSLYFAHHGETMMPFLALFDPANPVDCYERRTSVQPQQALGQSNSTLTIGAARKLAGPLFVELKSRQLPSEEMQVQLVTTLFERILNRVPQEEELRIAREFLQSQKDLLAKSPPPSIAPAESESKPVPVPGVKDKGPPSLKLEEVPPASDPELRAVENLIHALFNHNDFFTVR